MRGRKSCAVYVASALLYCTLFLSSAHAEPTPAAATDAYREAIQSALDAYERGRLVDARDAFQRAHALYPNARTLRGLGTVELDLQQYLVSAQHLEAALASQVLPLEGELRREAEQSLGAAYAHLSRIEVHTTPADAEVLLGGLPIERVRPITLEPGNYRLEAHASGYRSIYRDVTLAPGSNERVSLELVLEAITGPVSTRTAAPHVSTSPSASSSRPHPELAPWLVIGAGGVVTLTSTVVLALGALAYDEKASRGDAPPWPEHNEDLRREKRLYVSGAILLGAGLVTVAGGLWWRQRRARTHVELALAPHGLTLHGAF